MNLLITPALELTQKQKAILESEHNLFFLDDERVPLSEQTLKFDPNLIEGIICNFFFQNNPPSVLPRLRYVQLTSVGLDRVPIEDFKKQGVSLYNAGTTYATPMAEWTVGKILELYKCSAHFAKKQRMHKWEKHRDIRLLSGTVAAIIGFGNVGRGIAKRLKAFDVKISAVDIVEDTSGLSDEWFNISDLKTALKKADIVVVTLPLTDETYHILNNDMIGTMKDDAVLVNVARGALVDEKALLDYLQKGKFLGVALDVVESEPLSEQSPLWDIERVIITPHNSFVSTDNQSRLFELICKNLIQ